jgi:hypothetical protein
VVRIAAAKTNGEDYEQVARNHIETLYGYGRQPVLFKPTLAAEQQFRDTFEGALSYFVATNGAVKEDTGFAIKGWKSVRWENSNMALTGNTALAMGNYWFTTPDGSEVKVEYTFGYFLDEEGKLRINLHHSSMPFAAPTAAAPKGQVTREDVHAAQKSWGEGVVRIAAAKAKGEDYQIIAGEFVESLYGFVSPASAANLDAVINSRAWTTVRFEDQNIVLDGTTAIAVGDCFLTTPEGSEVKAEFSFGYFLDKEGKLRIDRHNVLKPLVETVSA